MTTVITVIELFFLFTMGLGAYPYAFKLKNMRARVDRRFHWLNPNAEIAEDVATHFIAIVGFGFLVPGFVIMKLLAHVQANYNYGSVLGSKALIVFFAIYTFFFGMGWFHRKLRPPKLPRWFVKSAIVLFGVLFLMSLGGCTIITPPGDDPDFPQIDGSWFRDHDNIIHEAVETEANRQSIMLCNAGLGKVAYVTHDEEISQPQEYVDRLREKYDVDVLWGLFSHTKKNISPLVYSVADDYPLSDESLFPAFSMARELIAEGSWTDAASTVVSETGEQIGYTNDLASYPDLESCQPPEINHAFVFILGGLVFLAWTALCFWYGLLSGDFGGAVELWLRGIFIILEAMADAND